ncbi:MAG: ATP-grasp domain-containing protein [Gammaproteobacteria bacterium]|jgi:3-methylcrotonyl-CoA carboxylase alpha subunit|nr:ATP-grasp domain-containing protein [Gammaproteobacteria bacterium]MDP6166736.1 biotin carboxylase N-terminal domain-containing protein [Gammaproteobacteria bacterium]
MLKSVLIANRGEIACRVIRTARTMGMRTIAVYSDADANALHVKQADEAWRLGGAAAADSYLCADKILNIALQAGAECIHPGYGFLSENADFVTSCQAAGIVFVGPDALAIQQMGSKSAAKLIMQDAGIPLVPGYHGANQDPEFLQQQADTMGYPLLIKAIAGGGGKGMRVATSSAEFKTQLGGAQREGQSSFGNPIVLLERYLLQPRHVEVQVFCDRHGNGVYLGDRDCSAQRRHQKVIEEAPAPGLSDDLRQAMGSAAVAAAKAIDYVGAGTVEFLLDKDGCFYFMEMNTRLQVEHPVTEMVTGQDLVAWQLQVAANQPLPLQQVEIHLQGHAVEARIYAEDPEQDFQPSTGTINHLRQPTTDQHVRVDTGVLEGDVISSFYDPMIAKLIVFADDREQALSKLDTCLQDYHLEGINTNIDFLRKLTTLEDFAQAKLHTNIIEQHQDQLLGKNKFNFDTTLALACLALAPDNDLAGLRLNQPSQVSFSIHVDTRELHINLQLAEIYTANFSDAAGNSGKVVFTGSKTDEHLRLSLNGQMTKASYCQFGDRLSIFSPTGKLVVQLLQPQIDNFNQTRQHDAGDIVAPMNGSLIACLVESGQNVDEGEALLVVEAMKMEHTIYASTAGIVGEIYYRVGDLVAAEAQLLHLNPLPQEA